MATPAGSGSGTSESTSSGSSTQPQQIITFQQAQTEDGTQVLIPVKIVGGTGGATGSPKPGSTAPTTGAIASAASSESAKPKRTGSLALLFRKVSSVCLWIKEMICLLLTVSYKRSVKLYCMMTRLTVRSRDMNIKI